MNLTTLEEWIKPRDISKTIERWKNCRKNVKECVEQWTKMMK